MVRRNGFREECQSRIADDFMVTIRVIVRVMARVTDGGSRIELLDESLGWGCVLVLPGACRACL